MQQYLITTDEVSALSRGMSVHLDPDKIETYIRESENIYIKSALGDELFLDVKKNPEKYQLLLDGGTYETKCKKKIIITGLRVALAYYTYACIVKNVDGNVSRFGFVNKEGEYSSHTPHCLTPHLPQWRPFRIPLQYSAPKFSPVGTYCFPDRLESRYRESSSAG